MQRLKTATLLFTLLTGAAHAENAKPTVLPPRPPLEAYGDLPNVEDVAISPGGTHIALVTIKRGERVLLDYDVAAKKSKAIKLGKLKVRHIDWADDVHIIVESSQTTDLPDYISSRDERYQAALVDPLHYKVEWLFRDTPDYYPIIMGRIVRATVNGAPTLFAPNMRVNQNSSRDLFAIDPNTGHAEVAVQGDSEVVGWAISPEGEVIARSEFDRRQHIWRLKFPTPLGNWKTVYSYDGKLNTPSLEYGLGRDGKSVIVHAPDKAGVWRYYEVSPAGVFGEPLEPPGVSGWPLFHPKTRRLIGFGSDPDDFKPVVFDPEIKRIYELSQQSAPGMKSFIAGFAEDPRKIILYAEGHNNPGAYYFINYAENTYVEIGRSYTDIPTKWVAEQRAISYKAADGLLIHGYLTLPPGRDAKSLPLIVFPHGGPWAHDQAGFDWWAQAMASRGYAVLQPNFRGSDGYGDDFKNAGREQIGKKMQTDLSDGVRDLAQQGLIDPKRVCIVGASYGGYAALAGATLDLGVYRCAASVSGISDLGQLVAYDEEKFGRDQGGVRLWRDFLGPKSGWDALSPIHNVKNVQIPILLVQGKDDTVVEPAQSTRMRDALQREGKTVEYVELKGEDHWLSTGETRLQMLKAVVAFVEKYNPADGEPVPEETPR